MVMTSPRVSRRRAGAHTPSPLGHRWRRRGQHRGVVEGHGLHAATLPERTPRWHRAERSDVRRSSRPRTRGLLACCPAHGVEAPGGPGAPLALQRGPGDRAVRAARPGHQPGAAADGVDDRRRPRSAVLVPARLPAHHVLGRRRLPARPARRDHAPPGCTRSRTVWLERVQSCELWVYRFAVDGSRRGPAPTATGCPTHEHAALDVAPVGDLLERHRERGIELRVLADLRELRDAGDRVGLPVLDVPDGQHPRRRQSCSGRSVGNRMTSRIDVVSVSSITRRSMPMPRPAVGGSPYSRARR